MDGTCVMDARKKGRQAASQEQGKKVCRGWWAEGFFCRPGLLGRKKCEGVSRIGLGSAGFGLGSGSHRAGVGEGRAGQGLGSGRAGQGKQGKAGEGGRREDGMAKIQNCFCSSSNLV